LGGIVQNLLREKLLFIESNVNKQTNDDKVVYVLTTQEGFVVCDVQIELHKKWV